MARCLEEAGIYISIDGIATSDIDLRDFVESSIQFISTVIAIETTFAIEFPDDLLTIDLFTSLKALVALVEELQTKKSTVQ